MSEEATNDEIEELRQRVNDLRGERNSVLADYEEGLYDTDDLLNRALALEIAQAGQALREAKAKFEDEQLPVM